MGKNQKDINTLFTKYKGIVKHLHLDIADGKFVPNTSLWFNFRLSRNFKYSAHLMINNPISWIKKHGKKMDTIIFSIEAVKDVQKVISEIKRIKKKVGISLNPETSISYLKPHLKEIDVVLILSVHPGFYGAKFLKTPLRKIHFLKRSDPNVKIIVDGGMKPKTAIHAAIYGADHLVAGSFIASSSNPQKAIAKLSHAFR